MPRAKYSSVAMTRDGNTPLLIRNAQITVYEAGTETPLNPSDLYAGATGPTTLPNPFTADADGNYTFYLAEKRRVDIKISATGTGIGAADYTNSYESVLPAADDLLTSVLQTTPSALAYPALQDENAYDWAAWTFASNGDAVPTPDTATPRFLFEHLLDPDTPAGGGFASASWVHKVRRYGTHYLTATPTAESANTATFSGTPFTAGALVTAGASARIVSGTGSTTGSPARPTVPRKVTANTSNQITVTPGWEVEPDTSTSVVAINSGSGADHSAFAIVLDQHSDAGVFAAGTVNTLHGLSIFALVDPDAGNAGHLGPLFIGYGAKSGADDAVAQAIEINRTNDSAGVPVWYQSGSSGGLEFADVLLGGDAGSAGVVFGAGELKSPIVALPGSVASDGVFVDHTPGAGGRVSFRMLGNGVGIRAWKVAGSPTFDGTYAGNTSVGAHPDISILDTNSSDHTLLLNPAKIAFGVSSAALAAYLDTVNARLGIGGANTSPAASLHVLGAGQATVTPVTNSGDQGASIFVVDSDAGANGGGFLGLGATAASGKGVQVGLKAAATALTDYGYGDLVIVGRTAAGVATDTLAELARITSAGHVQAKGNLFLQGGTAVGVTLDASGLASSNKTITLQNLSGTLPVLGAVQNVGEFRTTGDITSSNATTATHRISETGSTVNLDLVATTTLGRVRTATNHNLWLGMNGTDIVRLASNGLQVQSGNVAHGLTSFLLTNSWGGIEIADASNGGMMLTGVDDTASIGFRVRGAARTADTARSVGAIGAILLDAYKHDGSNTLSSLGTNANLLTVRDNGFARWLVDAEGDVHYDGTTNAGAWDDHEDVALLETYRLLTAPGVERNYRQRFSDDITAHADTLERTGVISRDPLTGRPWVSTKALNGLLIDAIRQERWRGDGRYAELSARLDAAESQLRALTAA